MLVEVGALLEVVAGLTTTAGFEVESGLLEVVTGLVVEEETDLEVVTGLVVDEETGLEVEVGFEELLGLELPVPEVPLFTVY